MRVTTPQFGRLTAVIADAADQCCEGRLVAVTEGGYDLAALAGSLRSVIDVLDGATPLGALAVPTGATPRADASLAAVRPYLSKFWTL
jgi:acetoin utilization deacetylase AcuC-like enzyme